MRLVNPKTGAVVETTAPVTITKLIYGEGYWVLKDAPREQKRSGPEKPAASGD